MGQQERQTYSQNVPFIHIKNDHTLLNLLVVMAKSESKKFLSEPALYQHRKLVCLFVNAYLHEPAACVIGLGFRLQHIFFPVQRLISSQQRARPSPAPLCSAPLLISSPYMSCFALLVPDTINQPHPGKGTSDEVPRAINIDHSHRLFTGSLDGRGMQPCVCA